MNRGDAEGAEGGFWVHAYDPPIGRGGVARGGEVFVQRDGESADLLGFLGEEFLILGLDPVARGERGSDGKVQHL